MAAFTIGTMDSHRHLTVTTVAARAVVVARVGAARVEAAIRVVKVDLAVVDVETKAETKEEAKEAAHQEMAWTTNWVLATRVQLFPVLKDRQTVCSVILLVNSATRATSSAIHLPIKIHLLIKIHLPIKILHSTFNPATPTIIKILYSTIKMACMEVNTEFILANQAIKAVEIMDTLQIHTIRTDKFRPPTMELAQTLLKYATQETVTIKQIRAILTIQRIRAILTIQRIRATLTIQRIRAILTIQ